MPHYVSSRCRDAPKFTIPKRKNTPLIAPLIPKGVKVVKDILPNVEKLSYADHDTKPQPDLDRNNYMGIVQDTPQVPQWFVAKEWAKELEQSSILPLLYMPHFGRSTQINTCVKQLLLFFHGGVLWLGKPILVDVQLVATITRLPSARMDPSSLLKKDGEAATT